MSPLRFLVAVAALMVGTAIVCAQNDPPPSRASAPPAEAATNSPLTPNSQWSVAYEDTLLGHVRGSAIVDGSGTKVSVRLEPQQTLVDYELEGTLEREGDVLTVTLRGRQPSGDPGLKQPDLSSMTPVNFRPEPGHIAFRVNGVGGRLPVRPRGIADADTVKLVLTPSGGTWSGEWSYRADALTERERHGGGRVGTFRLLDEPQVIGEQRGAEQWSPRKPVIYAALCIDEQTAHSYGVPSFSYPTPDEDRRGVPELRRLMIVGENLPQQHGEPLVLVSGDESHASYSVRALPPDGVRNAQYGQELGQGWAMLTRQMDPQQAQWLRDKQALLLNVRVKHGVKPGAQSFTLNGAQGNWALLFGDTTGVIQWVRQPYENQWEASAELFLPETVQVQVITQADLPLASIEVALGRNAHPLQINDAHTVTATKVPRDPKDPFKGTIYRTRPLRLVQTSRAADQAAGVADVIEADSGDELFARLADDGLILAEMGRARVNLTPASLGPLWKEYLKRAADCAGLQVDNWSTIGSKEADEVANYILFDATVVNIKGFNLGVGLDVKPTRQTVRVNVADHAAAMLLRDEFVGQMEQLRAELAKIQGPTMLHGFAAMLEPVASNKDHALGRVNVTAPNGHEIGAAAIFNLDWVRDYFKLTPAQAYRWREAALQQALDRYRDAIAESIRLAQEPDHCDVEALIHVTGFGFDAVAERVLPRLMTLRRADNGTALGWEPDRAARAAVKNLGILAQAVRAQQEYADVDTNIAVTVAALVAMPIAAAETALAKGVALGVDLAGIGVTAGIEIPDYMQRRDDVRFARGASAVLGTDVLDEAEAREIPAWQAVVSVAGAVAGAGLSGVDLLNVLKNTPVDRVRSIGEALLPRIERGGLAALNDLDLEQKKLLLAYMADAGNVHRTAGADALTDAQARALRTLDQLNNESRAAKAAENLDPSVPRPHVADPERLAAMDPDIGAVRPSPHAAAPSPARPNQPEATGIAGNVNPPRPAAPDAPDVPGPRPSTGGATASAATPATPQPTTTPRTPDPSKRDPLAPRPATRDPLAPRPSRRDPLAPSPRPSPAPARNPAAPAPNPRPGTPDTPPPVVRDSSTPPRPTVESESPTVRLPRAERPPTEVIRRPPSTTPDPSATTRLPGFEPPPARPATDTVRLPEFKPPTDIVDNLPAHVPPRALPDATLSRGRSGRMSRPGLAGADAARPAVSPEDFRHAEAPVHLPRPRLDPEIPRSPVAPARLQDTTDRIGGQVTDAQKQLDQLKGTPSADPAAIAAARDRLTDLKQRAAILKEIQEDAANAKRPLELSDDDLDWLAGRRTDLTASERQAAERLLREDFKGSWKQVTGALSHHDLSKIDMHKLLVHRKQVVDGMLDDVIRQVNDDILRETGVAGRIERKAFGSANLTSDYDLSVGGPGAERVVGAFNKRFRQRYGRESGTAFDTNVYTDPVYNLFDANGALSKIMADLSPIQRDELRQFMFEQMAMAKYTTDGQWERHVRRTIDAAPEDQRPLLRQMMHETKARETMARLRIKERLGTEPGLASADDVLRVTNDLYAQTLDRIDQMRSAAGRLARLGEAPGPTVLPDIFRGTKFESDFARLEQLTAARNTIAAKRLREKLEGNLARWMRNDQGHALYYASEAYQGEGTIRHVVKELQENKRPVELDVLLGRKTAAVPPEVSKLNINQGHYVSSFNENRANMIKELNGIGALSDEMRLMRTVGDPALYEKAATKAAKYFIRQLDSAHHAGVKLPEALAGDLKLIEQTLALDAARSTPAQFTQALNDLKLDPAEYVDRVLKAAEDLSAPVLSRGPIQRMAPEVRAYYDELEREIRSIAGVEDPFPISPAPKVVDARPQPPHASPPAPPGAPAAPPIAVADAADGLGTVLDRPRFNFPEVDGPVRRVPLPDPTGAHVPLMNQPPPLRDGRFVDVDNNQVPVGPKLGEGVYSNVYESGPDGVVKFMKQREAASEAERTPQQVAQMLHDNSRLLEDRGIRQLEVRQVQTAGDRPYVTARRATDDMKRFDYEKFEQVGRSKMIEDGLWSAEHERAVVDLFHEMARKNLMWEDGGLNNLYFQRVNGKLVAGILDQDRIADWSAPGTYMQAMRDGIAFAPRAEHIESLSGAGLGKFQFEGPEQFMAKMFEHKGWIHYDPFTGQFRPGLIDPDVVRQRFDIDGWIHRPKPPLSLAPLRRLRDSGLAHIRNAA